MKKTGNFSQPYEIVSNTKNGFMFSFLTFSSARDGMCIVYDMISIKKCSPYKLHVKWDLGISFGSTGILNFNSSID